MAKLTMPSKDSWSCDFRTVLQAELEEVGDNVGSSADDPLARAHAKQLVGLAFSGGGIRSATFNLGVLQSLARMNLLSKFNYLSTVSGGGYIGSWLIAWMKRRSVKDVHAGLCPQWGQQPGHTEPQEIHFLRRFSNYLTPKLGWLGADTWTVISIYLRNLILNLVILSAAFALILLIPRWVAYGSEVAWKNLPQAGLYRVIAGIAIAALAIATYFIVRSMRYFVWTRPGVAGKPIDLSNNVPGWKSNAGKRWYAAELFDDFILRLQFTIKGPGTRCVYIWDSMDERDTPGGTAAKIVIGNEQVVGSMTAAVTGTINGQSPARPAQIEPGLNELEIVCAGNECTVGVNKLTINTLRIQRRRTRGLLTSGATKFPATAIGYDDQSTVIDFNNVIIEEIESPSRIGTTQGEVQRRIIVPLFLAAFLATFLFGFGDLTPPSNPTPEFVLNAAAPMRNAISVGAVSNPWPWSKCAAVAGGTCALLVFVARLLQVRRRKHALLSSWRKRWRRKLRYFASKIPKPGNEDNGDRTYEVAAKEIARETFSIGFAVAIGGIVAWGLYLLFRGKTIWTVMIWGTPSLIATFLLTIILHIGFLGRSLRDERREWWSRLNAWLLIYALGWIAIFGTAFYAPILLAWTKALTESAISLAWIASTVWGLIAARSAATGVGKSNKLTELIAKVAPYVFVVGFFFLLSWAVDAVMPLIAGINLPPQDFTLAKLLQGQWARMDAVNTSWPLSVATAIALFAAFALSLRLDINQFSMHMLYRNRLGRCYLGASNRFRRAQPFTGFSADDDFNLQDLKELPFSAPRDTAPYPIINAALNLVGGKELAWQQRKAASFVFTPFYCGYEFPELPPGYCDTTTFASQPVPITLATAMAISGAAASPNMGYHTSPAPAFLMTVFNVRLGWWLGNPRRRRGWKKSGPLNVLWSLVCELFGLTSDEGKYIYLSDGGHFENLGVYELVRRRCRFIVACDAEEDHLFRFNGLGNAVEKCRADFGIDIDIDAEPIRSRSQDGNSKWHCAIGTIYYSRVDQNARDGILVYIKSSLTGDEPTDVLRYAAENPGFPHQSTADQWFDESQFESYRVLGFHIAQNVFGALGDVEKVSALTKEQLFVSLAQHWHPPSAATAEAFTKHTRTVVAIYDELRKNKDLAFLSEHIYPEWRVLFENRRARWLRPSAFSLDTKSSLLAQLPKSDAQLRAGFYICNSVFQLFEDAYVDLNLEEEFDHPDNRGWMNFFMHWSWAPMFRVAWTISASNYGVRFQSFCDRRLGLNIGRTNTREINLGKELDLRNLPVVFTWKDNTEKVAEKIIDAIWTWLAKLCVGSSVLADAVLTVNDKAPSSMIDTAIKEDETLRRSKIVIGQAMQRKKNQPIATRVPTLTDEEWHAASTLLEMNRRHGVDEHLKVTWAEKVVELALFHGAIIDSRVLNDDLQEEFNPIEYELLKLFFIFNPSLAGSARIFRLEISPDPHAPPATPQQRNLHFPFGFAILAKTEGPQRLDGRYKLVYFRVQDHLRRAGLARKATEQLIRRQGVTDIELHEMHPEAYEVPKNLDRLQFLRLFESVKIAVDQTKDA